MAKSDKTKYVTKKELMDALIGFSEAILEGVQRMFDQQDKKIDNIHSELKNDIKNVEIHLTDEIDGLKADFSTSVSRREFNELKNKVDVYLAVN